MKYPILYILLLFLSMGVLRAQNQEPVSMLELADSLVDSRPDSALYLANRAELILNRDDPGQDLPRVYLIKGEIYQELGIHDRSLLYFQKALQEYIKIGSQPDIAHCSHQIGNIYYELADYSDAYSFYLQSLSAREIIGDESGIARMENNLGTISHEMGDLDQAEKHYLRSHQIYKERNDVLQECRSLGNIGLVQYDRENHDSALYYFNEVLQKLQTDSIHPESRLSILTGIYNNLALIYIDRKEYERSRNYLKMGLRNAIELKDQFNISTIYINLGSLYGKTQNQDSALYYLHRALSIAKKGGYRHVELEVYKELSLLHASLNNYPSAYNWLLKHDTVYKNVFNEMQAEEVSRLEGRYEQELTEREIEQLQSESQVQKLLNKVFIALIVIIVALVVFIAVNLRSRKRVNQELAERNQEFLRANKRLSESEKELQKSNRSKDRIFSVVAHDLRNPVAAVTGFSELLYENFEQFPVETQKEYLLQILQGTQRVQTLLENLLVWARAQLESLKYQPDLFKMKDLVDECLKDLKPNLEYKRISCNTRIDRKCEVFADRAMIHTVLRNLLMNAVKFSFPGGKIWIHARLEEGYCSLTVSDEGIGIEPEIQEKIFKSEEVISSPGTSGETGSGLGLIICKEFIERNNGKIEVSSETGNGSTFTITLANSQKSSQTSPP